MPGANSDSSEEKKESPETVPEREVTKAPSPHAMSQRLSPASSPSNGSRSHAPPIMTNSVPARPPSAASVHSNGSTGPRSTTATSRRGGRTRSRSPPMMMQRPPSTGPPPEAFGAPDDRRAPPSPANPSAAAAAAAAAAKSMTRTSQPPPSSWYDSPDARERDYRRARYHPRYYEGGPPPMHPRHQWSEDAGHASRPPSRNRYPPRRPVAEDHYGYREGYASYRGRGGRGEPYPPPHHYEEYERPPSPGFDLYNRRRPREDPYYGQIKELEGGRAESGAPSSVKHTSRVLGGPTPIHMPRAPEPSSRSSRGSGSKSDSIFRGRPGADSRKPPSDDDNSPQKILMSLRTPSHSFEEQQERKRDEPGSPEAPPKIQHSHHQHHADSNIGFEPQKSPKSSAGALPPHPTSSIDMAPSFTLFNQSFDSIGDTANFFNVSGPLDSALRSSSFEPAPKDSALRASSFEASGSDEKTTELHLTSSTGNFSQQLLGGSTFEMSPNNSFGNGPSLLRTDSTDIMLLGGRERPSSPSQLLDMYRRSYSGGGPERSPRSKEMPLEDCHLRMSAGSMTAPIQSHSYSRSYSEGPPPPPHYRSVGFIHPETMDGSPGFYVFLKRNKGAFRECNFLLPGLKAALLQVPDVKTDAEETPKRRGVEPYGVPNPQDILIASRRVASAVCAFGGTILGEQASQLAKSGAPHSIFRDRQGDTATVTPNSSTATSPGSYRSRQRAKYDELMPSRYYENDNRLSWEFEETPPIDEMGRDEEEADELQREEGKNGNRDDDDGDGDKKDDDDSDGNDDGKRTSESKDGDKAKMRYRCKLCGQPKQNHTCPYQQSLARSIGTMIYPAVNAFTASEPGLLAPALTEMNNFISSGDSVSSADGSPSRPTPDRSRRANPGGVPSGVAQVTPESLRGTPRAGSSPVTTPTRARTPVSVHRTRPGHDLQRRYMGGSPSPASRSRKRSHGQMVGLEDQGELLFVESVELKPEQYRIVTASKIVSSSEAFTYPALPLPYAQRKRLSDNLFSLSKEVPQLTDECAAVLREAREKDMWDLAVAELMTQVVVVVHCHDGDSRFEGLRRYLMTLGIAC